MTNSTTFTYKAKAGIIRLIIVTTIYFLFIIPLATLSLVFNDMYWPSYMYPEEHSIIVFMGGSAGLLFIFACLHVILKICDIFTSKYQHLIINNDEIVYEYGFISKKTKVIPVSRIRSCKKNCGPIQRRCGSMNLSITTAGDVAEIYFRDIENGEEAFQSIRQLAQISSRMDYERERQKITASQQYKCKGSYAHSTKKAPVTKTWCFCVVKIYYPYCLYFLIQLIILFSFHLMNNCFNFFKPFYFLCCCFN